MQDMDAVYRQHFRMVYQYLMSLTHQPDVAEELAQETFCQAVSSIHRYDGSCKITTWLCAIAKNQYLSYLRKHPLHEDLTDTEAELPHTPAAAQEALSSAVKMELLQCLHQFQEPYREVIYLRVFGNLSFREIGQIMGQSENWARVMFYRGKERLRKELNKQEKRFDLRGRTGSAAKLCRSPDESRHKYGDRNTYPGVCRLSPDTFRYADSGTRAGRNGNGCFNYRLFKKEQQKEQTPDSCRQPDRDTVARQHLGISDVFLPCTAEKYRTDRLCGYRKRQ